jgi:long-chain acyl-CoA synthetase
LKEGFTEENRMMNSTMKMVRGVITENYSEYIEFLYIPESKNVLHEKNMEAMDFLLGE